MPHPHKGEKKKDFISRCIPILVDEGKEQKQAAAICFSFWERKDEETESIIQKVLMEAKNDYTVMFFDPALEEPVAKRKNTLVTAKIIKDKLTIVDGEVWLGASLEDDVFPAVADLVKKWKPEVVFTEDNYFQSILKKVMSEYNIPFKGVTRVTSKMAAEQVADSPDMVWKAKKNKDLFFGAGSLLLVLKKMKKIITESTVVADIEKNLTQDMPITERKPKKKKCKRKEKFKAFMSESNISFDDNGLLTKDGKMVPFGNYGRVYPEATGESPDRRSFHKQEKEDEKEWKNSTKNYPGGISIWHKEDGHSVISIPEYPTNEQFRVLSYIIRKKRDGSITNVKYKGKEANFKSNDMDKFKAFLSKDA